MRTRGNRPKTLWQPPSTRLLVRALKAYLERRPPVSLEPVAVIAEARKRTGLHDLEGHIGGGLVHEGLEQLCQSLDTEARLHPLGRFLAHQAVVGALVNRLEIVDWTTRFPEIEEQPTRRPIFIVGLPRTGTTLFHRLLASDPNHRAMLWWEGLRPCPPPALAHHAPDPRLRDARRAARIAHYAAPMIKVIHDSQPMEPDECVQLMANELASLVFPIQFRVPSYWDWLETVDLVPAYAGLRRQWQILQWQAPPQRWVGKAPAHLLALPALLRAFPDAVVVQTHRDPIEVVPSTCSLLAHAHSVGSDRVDAVELGMSLTDHLARSLARFDQDRRTAELAAGEATFVDIDYRALAADPVAAAREVYDQAGIAWSGAIEAAMRQHASSHPQGQHGTHCYRLEQFGLNTATIDHAFSTARLVHDR